MPKLSDEMKDLMETEDEKRQALKEIASKIMIFARDQIMVSMRFLDRALFRMPMIPSTTVYSFGVNGDVIYYNEDYVVAAYKAQKNSCTRAFLHMILHCIYSHPFQYEKLDRESWDLAADLAVERTILELKLKDTAMDSDRELLRVLKDLEKDVPIQTAEKLYRYFLTNEEAREKFLSLDELYYRDDHLHWIPVKETDAQQRTGDTITTDTRTAQIGCHEADQGEPGEQVEDLDEALVGRSQGDWEDITQHAKMDLETFSKEMGFGYGSLLWNLKEATKEKYDYTAFLKKFAVMGEEMHINDEEFDYVYYTYGLKLYDNMPLVEPLEYRENKRIKEFVIAIDTSGSCQGETVQRFLRKTYNILKSSESYFKRVNIHIIQCDSKIQHDVKVETDEEFEAYMNDVELSGFGGTDFRPVFEYVNDMVERHEFQDLKGLIYFTDGQGTFPERMPDYETAFVFVEDGFATPQVPSWAIKLVLPSEDI